MRLLIIADVFPPLRSSGAVQLRDLSAEFARHGHEVTVLVAASDVAEPWRIEMWRGVRVVRLRTPRTKDVSYLRRTFAEFLMPFAMQIRLRRCPVWMEVWDGVVWYSPTIFLGPVVRAMKTRSQCTAYLILRDIFPQWAVDMGLMGRGIAYHFFQAVANYQYSVADVIGVQTPGNCAFFWKWKSKQGKRLEVLQNWLAEAPAKKCTVSIDDTALAGRRIFVYAGNMGVAQGVSVMLDLAEHWLGRSDIGFVLVGRGSEAASLRQRALGRGLSNVLFFDEIDPDEIPGLYSQCHVGLVVLDPRHTTHNIPGKFLSYMQSGLPVFAIVNPDNDIVDLIHRERVGVTCTETSTELLAASARQLLAELEADSGFGARCRALSARLFSVEGACRQIVSALQA